MKYLIISMVTMFTGLSFAEVIEINQSLKSDEINKIVLAAATNHLSYEGDEVSGGVSGDLKNPTIIELTKTKGSVSSIKVAYDIFYYSHDLEFGDPVDEENVSCETLLYKGNDEKYSYELSKTACDYLPGDYGGYQDISI